MPVNQVQNWFSFLNRISSPIMNFLVPAGAMAPKQLPLYPVGTRKKPEVSLGEAPSPIMVFLKSATTILSELTRKTLVSDLVAQHRIQNLDEQSFANPTTSPTLVPLPRLPSTPGRRYGLEQGCPNPLAGGFGHHT